MASSIEAIASKYLSNSYCKAVLFMLGAITVLPCMNVTARYLSADYSITQIVWARYMGHLLFAFALFLPKHGIGLLRAQKPGIYIKDLPFGAVWAEFCALSPIQELDQYQGSVASRG